MRPPRRGGHLRCRCCYYPDETLQHAGVITGLGGYAGHSHKYKQAGGSGYMFRAATVQDLLGGDRCLPAGENQCVG